MTKKDIKLFKRFLKETKSYTSFFKYYSPEFIAGKGTSVIQYLDETSAIDVIDDAFNWEYTGDFNYWDDLDDDWRNFYRRAKNVSIEDALSYIGVT